MNTYGSKRDLSSRTGTAVSSLILSQDRHFKTRTQDMKTIVKNTQRPENVGGQLDTHTHKTAEGTDETRQSRPKKRLRPGYGITNVLSLGSEHGRPDKIILSLRLSPFCLQ